MNVSWTTPQTCPSGVGEGGRWERADCTWAYHRPIVCIWNVCLSLGKKHTKQNRCSCPGSRSQLLICLTGCKDGVIALLNTPSVGFDKPWSAEDLWCGEVDNRREICVDSRLSWQPILQPCWNTGRVPEFLWASTSAGAPSFTETHTPLLSGTVRWSALLTHRSTEVWSEDTEETNSAEVLSAERRSHQDIYVDLIEIQGNCLQTSCECIHHKDSINNGKCFHKQLGKWFYFLVALIFKMLLSLCLWISHIIRCSSMNHQLIFV